MLDEVSLDLTEQRVAIIGANGSGKSTLIRMINGLVAPTAGRVIVEGLDPVRQGREVRRIVSFLFSDPDAQIVMPTVAEDVAFSLRRHRLQAQVARQRVEAALERVGIVDLA
ncbi:MAG: ATP-binding cassette domain-containing protein, partial [Actinomycetales bacterium]